MERIATLHIEKLPEGFYLATSDDIPGLVVQGRTIVETVEIARDVAKKLLEAQNETAEIALAFTPFQPVKRGKPLKNRQKTPPKYHPPG